MQQAGRSRRSRRQLSKGTTSSHVRSCPWRASHVLRSMIQAHKFTQTRSASVISATKRIRLPKRQEKFPVWTEGRRLSVQCTPFLGIAIFFCPYTCHSPFMAQKISPWEEQSTFSWGGGDAKASSLRSHDYKKAVSLEKRGGKRGGKQWRQESSPLLSSPACVKAEGSLATGE